MSWSLEFVLYTEAKTDYGLCTNPHTIINHYEMEIDPRTITGIDYFKQEPRIASISLLLDTWLSENLVLFLNGMGNIIEGTPYWSYVVRIKYNGNIEYLGYVKRDLVSYDSEFGECKIGMYDSYGILNDLMKGLSYNEFFGGQISGNVTGLLANTISSAINFQFDGRPALDITINQNYNLVSGVIANNVALYEHSRDPELESAVNSNSYVGSFDDWLWYETGSAINVNLYNVWQTAIPKNVCSIYEYDGKLSVVFMKYYQRVLLLPDGLDCIFTDALFVRHFDIEQNIIITNKGFFYTTYSYVGLYNQVLYKIDPNFGYPTSPRNSYYTYYYNVQYEGTPSQYVYPSLIKAGLETQTVHNFNYTIGDDNYAIDNIDGNTFYYSGVANVSHVVINREREKTFKDMIDFLLLLNNLCLVSEKNGDIAIYNKNDSTINTITISDNDVVSNRPHGIIKSVPDYANITSVIENSESIAVFMKAVYKILFESLTTENDIEIENSYTLTIFDKAVVYGVTYKIASIHLDNERFIYTIKAWRI